MEHQRLIKRLTTKFSPICDKPYPNTINVKRKSKEHIHETAEKYLTGEKETEKLDKVAQDKLFRLTHKIKDIYKWDANTTDEKHPIYKTPGDGRVKNGGNRTGAGRPKGSPNKKGKKSDKKPTMNTEIEITNKIVNMEF